jgi:anti-sigma regulatory factor (Ser/Thr protein kinase)
MMETNGEAHASIDLASRAQSARAARLFIKERLNAWGNQDVAEAAELLTNELVTNSILHAGTDIVVEASHEPEVVRIEVSDFDGGAVGRRRGALDDERGRGLELVDALARSWGVVRSPGRKTVWFEISAD